METITTKKFDDYTLEITRTPEAPDPVIQTYDRGFLEEQLKSIQKSKDDFDNARDVEITEVKKLLELCDQNNIIVKPKQKIPLAEENKL